MLGEEAGSYLPERSVRMLPDLWVVKCWGTELIHLYPHSDRFMTP